MRKTKRQTVVLMVWDPSSKAPALYSMPKAAVMDGVLAAHHPVHYHEDGSTTHGKDWIITHAPSGYSLGIHYSTQRHAKKVMNLLLDMEEVEWESENIEVVKGSGRARILAVLERYMVDEPEERNND